MMTEAQFESLVGAYALDACDATEDAAVERFLAIHPVARADVARLRAAAVWLGATEALAPPDGLRVGLFERARTARRGAALSPLDAYVAEVERFAATLGEVGADEAETTTHNGLSIRELMLHLRAGERLVADEAVMPTGRLLGDALVREVTAVELAESADAPFATAVAAWRSATSRVAHVAADVEHDVAGHRPGDALVIRAFETWTHHDDTLRALGRPVAAPSVGVLGAMAALSMRLAPAALGATGRARPGCSALVRLTGAGGGEWLIALAPGEVAAAHPTATVTVDVVDWCRRFADRADADTVVVTVDGDAAVGRDLVLAAPAFAGL